MMPIEGQPILSAARMRAAEARAIADGATVSSLMERAGAGVAEAVRRLAAGAPVLILCGPGNNGGDGYVAARVLRANGVEVRVAALGAPKTAAAIAARTAWGGAVDAFPDALPDESAYGPVVVDAVFGTGLSRQPDPAAMQALAALVRRARLSVAVDLPSGVDSDTGAEPDRSQIPHYTLTLALGALKPAHVLQPAAEKCGAVRLVEIGLDPTEQPANALSDRTVERPRVAPPGSSSHKYSRGMVVVIGGAMPGAAALAASAAMHAGAGYVLLFGETAGPPDALVRRAWSPAAFARSVEGKSRDRTVIVVGPGLGQDATAAEKIECAIASGLPLVIDGDALRMLDDAAFARFARAGTMAQQPVVLTPHAGEFEALFGPWSGSKIEAARAAAQRSGATVVFKGADTVIAHPTGETRTTVTPHPWLSTAGTGDVLAGAIGAMLATTAADKVEAGVWMHGEAARRLGGAFIADDLARALSVVRAAL